MDQDAAGTDFSASASVEGNRATVVVTGEVDMSTADAMYRAAAGDTAGADGVTLDLRGVTFFDSAAIQALVRLAEHFTGRLEVVPSAQVHRVLDIAGLTGQPWLLKRD
ncbi:STAS domain-containing protein [Actinoplanes friuliensis]|uniref:Sulfate transporter/antisigma-factor antagonist n=1 Tax=Actinoplanes friuliensis DSM 7358 TaxID=1246995 RepID=U5WBT1_9ACTN|nr:STAS domain-containing protein [Actinoplanes friuliensis]AGZ45460.1 sulfate transporter/antisigma-factor antagonist [Actinoplanes friuliensis DSM 7358]